MKQHAIWWLQTHDSKRFCVLTWITWRHLMESRRMKFTLYMYLTCEAITHSKNKCRRSRIQVIIQRLSVRKVVRIWREIIVITAFIIWLPRTELILIILDRFDWRTKFNKPISLQLINIRSYKRWQFVVWGNSKRWVYSSHSSTPRTLLFAGLQLSYPASNTSLLKIQSTLQIF